MAIYVKSLANLSTTLKQEVVLYKFTNTINGLFFFLFILSCTDPKKKRKFVIIKVD